MRMILKSTVVGLGLMALTGLAAQAQSVSSLPPNTPPAYVAEPQGQTPYTTPFHSSQSFYPKPGGSEVINDGTAPSQSQANQPYSTGPKLN